LPTALDNCTNKIGKIEKKTDTKTGQAFCEGSQLFFCVCLFFFTLRNRLPKQKHKQMAKIVNANEINT